MKRTIVIAVAIVVLGCSKKDAAISDPPAGSAVASASSTVTAASASASASANATGAKLPGAKASYHGAYSLKPGNMYIPDNKDWNNVKFKNDESKLTGDGDLTLDVDGTKVSGTSEGGALGAAIIEGTVDGANVTANIRRKDTADQGLMGTLVAKIAGDKIEGTMRLSDANAAAVREATFSAATAERPSGKK